MRFHVAPILCAASAMVLAACGGDPPPPPKAPAPPPPPVAAVAPAPPPPAAAPKPKRVRTRPKVEKFDMAGDAIKLPGPVVFQTGSDVIDEGKSEVVLEIVHDYLEAKADISLLRIEGHTDSDGSPPMNQALSEKRAMSVARWLVGVGIDCKRLIPVGFGETKPLVPNTTSDNKAQNRRVMFVNAAVKGKPLGGRPVEGGGKVAGDPCR